MKNQYYLSRLPFNSGDGITRYCVAGLLTDDAAVDDQWAVTYCPDCSGALGWSEAVYGLGARKCMQCESIFLAHEAPEKKDEVNSAP